MKLRRPSIDDIPEIEDLAKKYENNPLPDRFITAAITEKYDDVKALGVLKSHLEALLYCDGTDKEKVESLKLLIHQATIDGRNCRTFDSIYVYAQDEKFAKVLEKHFGFRRANGVPMILDL